MALAENLFYSFKEKESFTLGEAYREYSSKPHETVRARIYDNLGVRFKQMIPIHLSLRLLVPEFMIIWESDLSV